MESFIRTAIIIERLSPSVDGGLFPVKVIVGETIKVRAAIFKDGHEIIKANIKLKKKKEDKWTYFPLHSTFNNEWEGEFTVNENDLFVYTVEAWFDPLGTWLDGTRKKCDAQMQVQSEVLEGVKLLKKLNEIISLEHENSLWRFVKLLELAEGDPEKVNKILTNQDFANLIEKNPLKFLLTTFEPELELWVERKKAEYSSWYEFFPRSQTDSVDKPGTLKSCIERLDYVKQLGFDVLYLPPIHPIGKTNRKGKNNSLIADENSPGSPWGIGSHEGGHKSIHPELGSFEDLEELRLAAEEKGIELALDIAIQCSPDHPYVKEHPEWFYQLPDGTIKYAENPPKKYQDIYPLDFNCEQAEALWHEMKDIFEFWISKGIKIFRVDNPHTKPFKFWEWVIREIKLKHPEVIFLAEAFTMPKPMQYLAKAGFTQSYTYFTWRNTKEELIEYMNELTKSEATLYFKGNFFANTPDILPKILQEGGKPAFEQRLILAATLNSNYGIFQGFEFCENKPIEAGSEEYLDSDKYEIKVRDFNSEPNLTNLISVVNSIRRDNQALHYYNNLEFYPSSNDNILCYGKRTSDNSNIIIVVINISPFQAHEDTVDLPLETFGLSDNATYEMVDLITNISYKWSGRKNYVRLDPGYQSAHIFKLVR
ncbi:MAG: maltotransferase domain-containing protein [Candidatus Caenarcaniphilales bacterium]|nr:maltotransferase domain-containing protein [Candidatus Caenarcaniphilales bacterium]